MTHSFYLADDAGAVDGPWLYPTLSMAQQHCDEMVAPQANGRCWDWIELDGEWVQVWTHSDTDAPTGRTGGTVTEIDGAAVRDAILQEPAAEVDRLRAELAKYVGVEPTVAEEMSYLHRCLDSVLALCDDAERRAGRWENPVPVPEWVEQVRMAAEEATS